MLARSLVAAGIRIFGLGVAFVGTRQLLGYIVMQQAHSYLSVPVFSFGASLAIFALLWLLAPALSSFFLPNEEPSGVAASAEDIEAVSISLMGLYFSLAGINRLAFCLMKYCSLGAAGADNDGLVRILLPEVWSSIFQILLGAALLIGVRPILKFLRKMRTAGLVGKG